MPVIINPEELTFKASPTALESFGILTLSPRLSAIAHSGHFYFDIRKLEHGKYSFPYHFHRNAEELMIVISGTMTVRMPDGFEVVKQGQLLFFEEGETGAHQFYNHTEEPCIYLDIRSNRGIDVTEYPDSGKLAILPSGDVFDKDSKVDYNKGEEDVENIWDKMWNDWDRKK